MKKFKIYMLLFGLLLSSCSKDTEPNPEPAPETLEASSLLYPENNKVCVESDIVFNWNNDSDLDLNYILEIARNNDFSDKTEFNTGVNTSKEISLEKGVLYYWKIRAVSTQGNLISNSKVYSFYTEAEAVKNYLPFPPELVSPEMNSEMESSSVLLKWIAKDADEDVLNFDVLLGTDGSSLDEVASNIEENEWTFEITEPGKYYWKIDVKDQKGGITEGQIWSFIIK